MTRSLVALALKPISMALLIVASIFAQAASGVDVVLYGQTATTSTTIHQVNQYIAQSFNTNAIQTQNISNVSLYFNSFHGGSSQVEFYLYNAGSPNTPGSILQTLGQGTVAGAGDVTVNLAFGTPISLLPSTQYFIVAKNLGTDDVKWYYSSNPNNVTTNISPKPTYYSLSSLNGTSWTNSSSTNVFAMTVTGVPEPSTYAFAAISAVSLAVVARRRVKA